MAPRVKAKPGLEVSLTSADVLAALRKSAVLNSENDRSPCAMIQEVSSGTGAQAHRRADALVVSLWPSRGIWFAGVEVKVSRTDWLNELKSPAKAAAILRWCDFWWLATAEGVASAEEIPERWGWIEVVAGKSTVCHVRKAAPKLEPEPLDASFVAAVLRKVAVSDEGRRREAYERALADLSARVQVVDEAEAARLRTIERDHEDWLRRFNDFCEASGENFDDIRFNAKQAGKARALAAALVSRRHGLFGDLAGSLRRMADEVEAAEAELKRATAAGRAALENAPLALGLTREAS